MIVGACSAEQSVIIFFDRFYTKSLATLRACTKVWT